MSINSVAVIVIIIIIILIVLCATTRTLLYGGTKVTFYNIFQEFKIIYILGSLTVYYV